MFFIKVIIYVYIRPKTTDSLIKLFYSNYIYYSQSKSEAKYVVKLVLLKPSTIFK